MPDITKTILIYISVLILSGIGWFTSIIGFTSSSGDIKQRWFIALIVFVNLFLGSIGIMCFVCIFGKCINSEPQGFNDIIMPQYRNSRNVELPQTQQPMYPPQNHSQQLPPLQSSMRQPVHRPPISPRLGSPRRDPSPGHGVEFYPPIPSQPNELRNQSRHSYPPGHRVCTV
jgi:hypothetical protein